MLRNEEKKLQKIAEIEEKINQIDDRLEEIAETGELSTPTEDIVLRADRAHYAEELRLLKGGNEAEREKRKKAIKEGFYLRNGKIII